MASCRIRVSSVHPGTRYCRFVCEWTISGPIGNLNCLSVIAIVPRTFAFDLDFSWQRKGFIFVSVDADHVKVSPGPVWCSPARETQPNLKRHRPQPFLVSAPFSAANTFKGSQNRYLATRGQPTAGESSSDHVECAIDWVMFQVNTRIPSASYKPEWLKKPGQNFNYNSMSSPHSRLVISSTVR
jgi:hypothetical protein